jgi:hypothetical protein
MEIAATLPSLFRHALLCLALVALAACSGGGGGGNPAPVAVSDAYGTGAGQLTLAVSSPGVLGNDTGSGITAEQVLGPSSGTLTLNPDGSFSYVHSAASPLTTDSFTYRARNSAGTSANATVTINITPPVANPDSYSINSSGPVSGGNVLGNDIPSTGVTAWLDVGPTHAASGTFALNSNGSFTYTHNGDTSTTDSFTYHTKAGAIVSNTVTVTININQPPVATNSFAPIYDDTWPTVTNVTVNLQATDPNGSGTIASYVIDTLPLNGSIAGCAAAGCALSNGSVTYTPKSNGTGRRGMDKFTFHVTDSGTPPLSSGTATAWILNNGNVRIMPLGDSITAGITSGSNPLSADRIGYRKDLYDGLTTLSAGKYGIDFVGSLSDGSNFLSDTNHEGHPGWCDDNASCGGSNGVAENVIGFLDASPADVILLHIGTNNFSATYTTGVKTILDNISTWAQTNYPVTVMVARIIPATDGSNDVQAFNNAIATMIANTSPRTNVKVFMVDQQAELYDLGQGVNFALSSLMASVLHPNDINGVTPGSPSGYGKMAQRWQADLITDNVAPIP